MGGKPVKHTPADKRLKENNPNAGRPATPRPVPMPAKKSNGGNP